MVLTDEEITAAVAGTVCLACSGMKRSGQPFCRTDFCALPLRYRRASEFRSALAHLQAHRDRRALLGDDWPYKTLREVADAGYEAMPARSMGWDRCQVPGCGAQILFVRKDATTTPFPINRSDARPHRTSCTDPEYFRRRREERERRATLKTSAGRKRRLS
jgi:hypothetical protein